jgi:hypothetical protein
MASNRRVAVPGSGAVVGVSDVPEAAHTTSSLLITLFTSIERLVNEIALEVAPSLVPPPAD